jgi:UDP-N-acetylglucosamine enolpyruvyl transferase
MLPDMVEIGSWIGLAAMTKSEITIKNVNWNQLGVIPNTFRKLGIQLEQSGDDILFLLRNIIKFRNLLTDLFNDFRCTMGIYSGFIIHYFSSSNSGKRKYSGSSENV